MKLKSWIKAWVDEMNVPTFFLFVAKNFVHNPFRRHMKCETETAPNALDVNDFLFIGLSDWRSGYFLCSQKSLIDMHTARLNSGASTWR